MTRRCRPSLITSVLLVLALGEVQHAAPAAAQKGRPSVITCVLLVVALTAVPLAARPAAAQSGPPTVVYRSDSF